MRVVSLWVDMRGYFLRNLYRNNLQDLVLSWIYRPNELTELKVKYGFSGMPIREGGGTKDFKVRLRSSVSMMPSWQRNPWVSGEMLAKQHLLYFGQGDNFRVMRWISDLSTQRNNVCISCCYKEAEMYQQILKYWMTQSSREQKIWFRMTSSEGLKWNKYKLDIKCCMSEFCLQFWHGLRKLIQMVHSA